MKKSITFWLFFCAVSMSGAIFSADNGPESWKNQSVDQLSVRYLSVLGSIIVHKVKITKIEQWLQKHTINNPLYPQRLIELEETFFQLWLDSVAAQQMKYWLAAQRRTRNRQRH